MVNLDIALLPKQREVLEHSARFKTLCCGRRWGKSRLAAYILIISALSTPNSVYYLVSPQFPQTKIIWRMLKKYIPKESISRIMEGELYIEFKNGSLIFAKSGDNPDSLRGEGLWGVVLDEAAMLKPEVWHEAVRPALADHQGWAIFTSTPKGKNWYYKLFLRGLIQNQNEYASFHYTTKDNPTITDEEIRSMSEGMSELEYDQEILAKFLDLGGVVFRGLDKVIDALPEEPIPGEFYVLGVDLGRHKDFTVIKVGRLSTMSEVYRERFNKTEWSYIKDRIRAVYNKYNRGSILMDSTGYGDPIYEDLAKEGLNIHGINLNVSSKPALIENLQLMIENQLIHLIDDPDMALEFGAYSYTVLPTGNVRYEASKGFHDDIVIGTALMAYGMYGGGNTGMIGMVDPDPHEDDLDYDEMEDFADWYEDEEEDLTEISTNQD